MIDGLKDMLLCVTDADEAAKCHLTVSANELRPGNILKILVRGKNENPDGSTRYWQLPINIKIK